MTNLQLLDPVKDSNKGCFDSFTHRRIDLQYPNTEMICIEDIANALSNICRFGGHIKPFYNVAQHSLIVTAMAPFHLKKAAFLHDAAEAYLGDVIKPLKNLLGLNYKIIENNFEAVIFQKFGVDVKQLEEIKEYDMRALEIEHEHFFKGGYRLKMVMKYFFKSHTTIWNSELSEKIFLATFHKLWTAVEIANIRQLPQEIEVTAREMTSDPEGLVDTYNHDIYLSDGNH